MEASSDILSVNHCISNAYHGGRVVELRDALQEFEDLLFGDAVAHLGQELHLLLVVLVVHVAGDRERGQRALHGLARPRRERRLVQRRHDVVTLGLPDIWTLEPKRGKLELLQTYSVTVALCYSDTLLSVTVLVNPMLLKSITVSKYLFTVTVFHCPEGVIVTKDVGRSMETTTCLKF